MAKPLPTICSFCGCGCGLYFDVGPGGDVIGVVPSSGHPVSQGRLCRRGWHLHQPLRSSERWRQPSIRQGYGRQEVSWLEAVAAAAAALQAGPIGVLGSARSTNEDAFVLQKLARTALGTNNVDFWGRASLAPTQMVFREVNRETPTLGTFADLATAHVLLAVGLGDGSRYPQVWPHLVAARRRGAAVVVVDDWQGDLAAQATHLLLPRPHTDPAWLYGLAACLRPESARNLTLAEVEAACGVPAADLQKVANELRSATRVALVYDPASPTRLTGLAGAQALATLAIALGHTGAACTILPLAERCNSLGVLEMGLAPHLLSGYQPLASPEVRDRFAAVWNTSLPSEPGLAAVEMVQAVARGELAGLLVVADGSEEGEWAGWIGEALPPALSRLKCLILLEGFPSSLSEHATVIFPRPLPGEQEGTFTNLEGRVQWLHPQVPLPEGMLPEWKLLTDLAAALNQPFSYGSTTDLLREIATLTPAYLEVSRNGLKPGGWLRPLMEVRSEREVPLPKPSLEDVKAVAEASPSPSADFPFLLLITRMDLPWELDGLVHHASTLRREVGPELGAYVRIHPDEARQLALRPAQRVAVTSSQGQVELNWQADPAVPAGRLIAPQRFLPALRPVLGEVKLDPASGAPLYPAAAVKVSRTA